MKYDTFIEAKVPKAEAHGVSNYQAPPWLFDFQAAIVTWAVRKGSAAIFADTVLGKTRMQLAWASALGERTLIVCPLAVAEQTIIEAHAVGIVVQYATQEPDESTGIWITNYERLDKFKPSRWGAVVLDESSILKSVDGKTRSRLISEWSPVPYRLCCTATPAPNDIAELANHCEFLQVMSRAEMLATFFVHDEAIWRLKGHAKAPFFRWMASWAAYIKKPSDIGFSDDGFALPNLTVTDRVVATSIVPYGTLFPHLTGGIRGRLSARRDSIDVRVAETAKIIADTPGQWLVWCGLNNESTMLADALGDQGVAIAGRDSQDDKIERERRWRTGAVRVLISKPRIFGFGMNWQHCHQMIFLGLNDSWEQYYQAIRRCWRFRQEHPVNVIIVISDQENRIADNIKRKEGEALMTASEVIKNASEQFRQEIGPSPQRHDTYKTGIVEGDDWKLLLGDCAERLKEIECDSVGLTVHSPPFSHLYVYSSSLRDMGNSRDDAQFFEHYKFAIKELLRVTMPGRRACVHIQQLTSTLTTHGEICWRDFRGDVIRAYQAEGWLYDGEVVIDKDPQAQAIRTKSKALLFVQKNKDSSWSRPALADYIILFRKPGDNQVAVDTDVTNEEWIQYARPIWYGIRESDTLHARLARDTNDERHLAPLQLGTIERCIRMWSNKGDLVVDPFNGIGSTGYVALRWGRKYIGIELKQSYYTLAAKYLASAKDQLYMFDQPGELEQANESITAP